MRTEATAGILSLVGIFVLLGLLIQKEVSTSADKTTLRRLGQLVNVGIIPLLMAFVMIVVFKVMEVLK